MSTDDEELYPCVGVCMVDEASGQCMGCGKPVFEPAPSAHPAPTASVGSDTAQE
jgi:hypothetical protein